MEFSTLNGYKVKDKKAIRFYDNVESMKSDTTLKSGMHVKTKGYYSVNDGGSSEYHITDTQSGTEYQEELNNGLYATLIVQDVVNVKQLGAKGDGIHDDYSIIQLILNTIKNGSTIYFPTGTYNLSDALIFNPNSINLLIKGDGKSTLNFINDTDGLVLTSTNENYGHHNIENLIIKGLNNYYSGTDNFTSTKSGLNLTTSYYNNITNCEIRGFKNGVLISTGIHNTFNGNTSITSNEIGVLITGNASNLNVFNGTRIRLNSSIGVYINGLQAPGLPTANVFDNCYIESNNPYPNIENPSTVFDGTGIYISNGYNTQISKCYFENLYYSIYLDRSSDNTYVNNCYLEGGGATTIRDCKIGIYDNYTNNNKFNQLYFTNAKRVNLIASADNQQRQNQAINCSGLNPQFDDKTYIDCINCSPNTLNEGRSNNALINIGQSYVENVTVGTNPGQISQWGVSNATLNASGIGEMRFVTVNDDTTIENITMVKGQILVLTNYQIAHSVTLKHGNGINGIKLNNDTDCVLSKYSDSIMLYCTRGGKIIEVGRSISNS